MIPKVYNIDPMPKPRMTQSDKWKQRPCVMKYRAFKDEVRRLGITVPESGAHITFYIPMPKSWPKRKRALTAGRHHKGTPDVDNLAKGLLDAIFKDDSHISDIRISKRWNHTGHIAVEEI